MKRDMDYLKDMLIRAEESEDGEIIAVKTFGPGAEELKRLHHVELAHDLGLIAPAGRSKQVYRLTYAGHDFVDMSRDDTAWKKIKRAVSENRIDAVRAAASITTAALPKIIAAIAASD